MAGQKKIGGILIENSFKSDGSIYSIVGLGLNVNQRQFEKLPLASSIAEILGSSIDKQALLNEIVLRIKKNVDGWKFSSKTMTEKYTELLFRRNKWTTFQFEDRSEFCGMVLGISESGKLVIAHESGSNQEYDIKEVKMIF
jgi:BirA family biotin operon repressor/biotin-[acetyl-CoA-carboxylase] ligase